MKCIENQSNGDIRRVSDQEAARRVSTGAWKYIAKSFWKNAGRP